MLKWFGDGSLLVWYVKGNHKGNHSLDEDVYCGQPQLVVSSCQFHSHLSGVLLLSRGHATVGRQPSLCSAPELFGSRGDYSSLQRLGSYGATRLRTMSNQNLRTESSGTVPRVKRTITPMKIKQNWGGGKSLTSGLP